MMRWINRHLVFTVIAFSLIGSFAVYGNTIKGGFVFDDVVVVEKRPDLKSIMHFPTLFIEPYHLHRPQSGLFRPLTMVSYLLNHAIVGHTPGGFHVVNMMLHAFASALVFWLIAHLFARRDVAWISWLLFLVLPIHTEAVASIVGRAEILAFIFSLLCIYYSLPGRQVRVSNRVLCAVSLLFALWSKESAAMVVPLLALIHVVKYRAPWIVFLRRFAYLSIPIGIYILTRAIALKQYFIHSTNTVYIENPLMFVPFYERIFTALKILVLYLGKLLVPIHLLPDYSYDTITLVRNPFSSWMVVAGALLLVLMVWAIVRLFRNQSYEIFGYAAAFFLGFWLLTSNLIIPVGTIMGERLMYAPSVGFVLLLAWGFAALAKIKYVRTASAILLVLISLLYAGRAIARNSDWHDTRRLFSLAVVQAPRSVLIHTGLAGFAITDERWDDARRELGIASSIYPEYSQMFYLQGLLAEHDKDYVKAEELYRRSIAINPAGPAVLNLADLLSVHGRFAETEPFLKTVVELLPLDEYVIRYAYTEIVLSKSEVALEIIHRYYGDNLNTADLHAVVGTADFQLARYPEALEHLQKARQLGKTGKEIDQMISLSQQRIKNP